MKRAFLKMIVAFTLYSCNGDKFTSVDQNQNKDSLNASDKAILIDFGYGYEIYNRKDIESMKLSDSLFTYNFLTSRPSLITIPIQVNTNDTSVIFEGKSLRYSLDEDSGFYSFASKGNNIKKYNFICFDNRYYSLDSIYDGSRKNSMKLRISSGYLFSFNQEKYLLIYVSPIITNATLVKHKGVLVRMSKNFGNSLFVFPDYQYSNSSLCLNDFDGDNTLDFGLFSPSSKTVKLYHVKNDGFNVDNRYGLKLENFINNYYNVNFEESKWIAKYNLSLVF